MENTFCGTYLLLNFLLTQASKLVAGYLVATPWSLSVDVDVWERCRFICICVYLCLLHVIMTKIECISLFEGSMMVWLVGDVICMSCLFGWSSSLDDLEHVGDAFIVPVVLELSVRICTLYIHSSVVLCVLFGMYSIQTSEGKSCVCVFLILLPLLFPFLRVQHFQLAEWKQSQPLWVTSY